MNETDRPIDKRLLHARGVLTDNNLFGPDEVNPDPLGGSALVKAKGFSASGCLEGRSYWIAVFWGGELGSQVELRGWAAEWVSEELATHVGDEFQLTIPGPWRTLSLDDSLSILTALMCLSRDFEWQGDKPPGYPRSGSGREPLVH